MDEKISQAVDKITNFYLGDLSNMNIQHINSITKMMTDAVFAFGVHDFVTRHLPNANDNSIFQYLYVHEGEYTILTSFTDATAPYGVCHADELSMLFSPLSPAYELNAADTRVSNA